MHAGNGFLKQHVCQRPAQTSPVVPLPDVYLVVDVFVWLHHLNYELAAGDCCMGYGKVSAAFI